MGGGIRALVVGVALSMMPAQAAHAGQNKPAQTKSVQARPAIAGGPQKVEAILDDAVLTLWHQGDEHWHEGEYNHIINICRVVAAARPNMMDAYGNAGWLLWSMNRDDEAVALYEQGLKANPDSYHMYDELGFYFYNRKKDYPRAIGYYEKAVGFKDCEPFTINMLAHSYERTRQMDKALKMWERAAAIPGNSAARPNLERIRKQLGDSPKNG